MNFGLAKPIICFLYHPSSSHKKKERFFFQKQTLEGTGDSGSCTRNGCRAIIKKKRMQGWKLTAKRNLLLLTTCSFSASRTPLSLPPHRHSVKSRCVVVKTGRLVDNTYYLLLECSYLLVHVLAKLLPIQPPMCYFQTKQKHQCVLCCCFYCLGRLQPPT